MSYASLLVHVDVDRQLDGRSSIAADLADRFHALLIGLAAWAPMSVFPAERAVLQMEVSYSGTSIVAIARP